MGQDRKILVCSETGKIWNMKKKWAVSYAVICLVIIIIYLILFFTEERERQKRERKLVKYCCLCPGWLYSVAVSCLDQFQLLHQK